MARIPAELHANCRSARIALTSGFEDQLRFVACVGLFGETGSMQWAGLIRNVMLGREGLSRNLLLDVIGSAGGSNPRSYLTTGNVTFYAARSDIDDVVDAVEAGIEQVLGQQLVAVRSTRWLRALVAESHFEQFIGEEWETEVAFLRHNAPAITRDQVLDSRRTVLVQIRPREILAARPRTGGGRPHVNRLLEQASHSPATSRGWSTLQRLAAAPAHGR